MTRLNEKVNGLAHSPLFDGLSEEKLQSIARVVVREVVPAHTTIFRQGEPGDSFYIITSGKVRVFRKSEEGVETSLSVLGPGDSFGEMALLTEEVRSAHVETLEETQFLVLTKDQFDQVLKKDPNISHAFFKQMSGMLLREERRIEKETERQSRAPRMSYIDFLVVIGVSLLTGIIFNMVNPNGISLIPKIWSHEAISNVVPAMAIAKHSHGEVLFIDARPSPFFEKERIKNAANLPLSLFDIMYMLDFSDVDKKKEIVVYGKTISSLYDQQVARKLILRGHKSTMILKGGLSGWKKKGFPVEP